MGGSHTITSDAMSFLVCTLMVLCLVAGTASGNEVISRTFTQQISHDAAIPSPGTFQQRYFLSGPVEDMKPGSPLIVYMGPETATGAWSAQEGTFQPTTWAINAGGLMLSIEHRYFGQSLPFGKNAYKRGNMKYLTVENALADYITILEHVLSESSSGPHPVMAFGGSYGGLLAAAIRMHYPHHINASLASAAPMYQFGEVANSTWYDEVSETLLSFKDDANPNNCGQEVQAEFAAIWDTRNSPAQRATLQSRFGLCDPVVTLDDLYMFMSWAKLAFSEVVQFSYPRAQPPCDVADAINVVCSETSHDHMATAVGLIYNFTPPFGNPVPCFSVPGIGSHPVDSLPSAHQVVLPPAVARRVAVQPRRRRLSNLTIEAIPWMYLCCTEIVMPVAGTGIFAMPAPFDLASMASACNATYGVTPDPTWYKRFLSKPLTNTSNIVFSNGGYDPVRGFSPATDLSQTVIAIDIPAMAHTFDLFATMPGDPEDVVKAREEEWNILLEMLHL